MILLTQSNEPTQDWNPEPVSQNDTNNQNQGQVATVHSDVSLFKEASLKRDLARLL